MTKMMKKFTLEQARLVYRMAYMEQRLSDEADRVKAGSRR